MVCCNDTLPSSATCGGDFDTYDNLINLYISMGDAATNADWLSLANKIIDNYTYFPPASYDLIKVVSSHISNIQDRLATDQKLLDSLQRANNATDSDTLQKTAVKELSAALLGKAKVNLASFSFDGEDAGKIMIDQAYRDYDFELSYSLDGGKTYSAKTTNHTIQLSEKEILSITAANDIKLKMTGTDVVNTIDIIDHKWPTAIYGNDLENRIVDVNLDMEWRLKNEDGTWPEKWTTYVEQSPDLTGNKVVQVRMRSMSNKKFSSPIEFTFTQDTKDDSRRYIPVSHLSISGVGSEVNSAAYAINGNYNNYWQSSSTSGQKWIEIKLAKPIYVSAIEFVPGPAIRQSNGEYQGRIYSATITNPSNRFQTFNTGMMNFSTTDTTIDQAKADAKIYDVRSTFIGKMQVIRITFSSTSYVNIRGINIYQDLTKEPRPTAGIGYSTTEPTNESVVARLINKSSDNVRITNNEGNDTYTFTENGSFTFEFIDDDTGKTGSATATVDWIDKQAPTATIEYDVKTTTNGSVFATLIPSEDITVTSIDKYRENADGKVIDISGNVLEDLTIAEGGYVKDIDGNTIGNVSPFIHIFRQNGSYTFEFEDKAGNKGEATATVDWIDQTAPEATVFYDITQKTNQKVTARVEFDKKDVTIINNEGRDTYTFTKNGEFTFEFRDSAGNVGSKKVAVSWIDVEPPTATPKYSTTNPTNKSVTVTLTNPSEEIIILNNEGRDTHTFTQNGEFTFEIIDKVGNKAEIKTAVDWIDTDAPTATIEYSTTNPTNQKVVATLKPSEDITVTNSSGIIDSLKHEFTSNGEFTFEFVDKAGNVGSATAKVNWIDTDAPTAEIKYEKDGNKVVVKVINPSEEIIYAEGIGIYEFTKNGNYEIVFYDKAGNMGKVTASITSFKEETANPSEPNNPDIPDNSGTTAPNNPSNSDNTNENVKPENSNNSGNDKPNDENNQTMSNNSNEKENKPINTEYKKFNIKNITVDIPQNEIKKEGTVQVGNFELEEEIKRKFGNLSEYYDIYFANNDSNRINMSTSSLMKISIKLNQSKNFVGVYEITEGNIIKEVDYVKNGNNIEIATKSLGKYVVSYKELKSENSNLNSENNLDVAKETKNKGLSYIIGSLVTITIIGMLNIILKHKKAK